MACGWVARGVSPSFLPPGRESMGISPSTSELGYPPDIIAIAEQSRDEVLLAIRAGIAFDELTTRLARRRGAA
jgi:hypothetical protein